MKLNFGQKLLLFVHWLLSLIGCVLAAMLLIVPDTVYGLFDRGYDLISKRTFDTIGIVVCAVYLLISVGCVIMIFSGSSKRQDRGLITVYSNETGKTRIAVSAVEQMTRQAVCGVEGISDVKASITGSEDAIGISISLVLKRGAYLPTVTANIQRTVRGYIEQNCGVVVHNIVVNVRAVEGEAVGAAQNVITEAPAEAPAAMPAADADPGLKNPFRPLPDMPEEPKTAQTDAPAAESAETPAEAPAQSADAESVKDAAKE